MIKDLQPTQNMCEGCTCTSTSRCWCFFFAIVFILGGIVILTTGNINVNGNVYTSPPGDYVFGALSLICGLLLFAALLIEAKWLYISVMISYVLYTFANIIMIIYVAIVKSSEVVVVDANGVRSKQTPIVSSRLIVTYTFGVVFGIIVIAIVYINNFKQDRSDGENVGKEDLETAESA